MGPLAVGSIVSGVGAYLVIALGTRAVGETLFAPVSVLWSLWALTAAAISFPVQHWAIRNAETHGEATVRAAVPRLAAMTLVGCVVAGSLSLALGARLYPSSSTAFSMMTACLPIGSLVIGLERGLLAHRRRYAAVAMTVSGENVVRAVVAAGVLVWGEADGVSSVALGWGIIAGFGVAFVAADILVPPRERTTSRPASMRLLGGFAGANVAAQAALTSGPVLLALLRAPEATVTQVFAILALLRVPYTGIVGASAAITGPLTRMASADRGRRLRRWELGGAALTAIVALAAGLLAPLLLPPLVGALFAADVSISGPSQSFLAAGGILAVAGLFEMLLMLSRNRPRQLLAGWSVGLAVGGACLTLPLDPAMRVSVAFLVAELGALVWMLVGFVGSAPATGNGDHG